MGEQLDNIRELVKSLQDLGVHAGSPSEVVESLKRENTELRQTRDDWIERAFRAEEQRDELLAACEGLVSLGLFPRRPMNSSDHLKLVRDAKTAIAAAKGRDTE